MVARRNRRARLPPEGPGVPSVCDAPGSRGGPEDPDDPYRPCSRSGSELAGPAMTSSGTTTCDSTGMGR